MSEPTKAKFTISFDGAVTLPAANCFGEPRPEATVGEVIESITDNTRGLSDFLSEWCLEHEVTVSVDGHEVRW